MRTALLALLLAACVDPLAEEVGARWTCAAESDDGQRSEYHACWPRLEGDALVELVLERCVADHGMAAGGCHVSCAQDGAGEGLGLVRSCPDPSGELR